MLGELGFAPGVASHAGLLIDNPALGGIAGETFLESESFFLDPDPQTESEDVALQEEAGLARSTEVAVVKEAQPGIVREVAAQDRPVQSSAAAALAAEEPDVVRPPLAKKPLPTGSFTDTLLSYLPKDVANALRAAGIAEIAQKAEPLLASIKSFTDKMLGVSSVASDTIMHSAKVLGGKIGSVIPTDASAATRAAFAAGLSLCVAVFATGCGMGESLTSLPVYHAFANLAAHPESSAIITEAFVFKLLGGLGIFLWGMHAMSDNMEALLGDNITKFINWAANKVLLGVGMGAGVTGVIQTSSGTSSIAVGMVNANKLSLEAAIAILMGANIGTTVTPWLPKLPFAKWGLPVIGATILAHTVLQGRVKKEQFHSGLKAIGGLGMLFYGLELMGSGFKNDVVRAFLSEIFSFLQTDTTGGILTCVGLGAAITSVVQSSSLVIMVVIPLAAAGVIDFQTAIALILGLNIGTTVTAQFAAMGKSANAKRAAHFHTIFNILGTAPVAVAFSVYFGVFKYLLEHAGVHAPVEADFASHEDFIHSYEAYISTALALFHTFFNIQNTALFIPFRKQIANMLRRLVKDSEVTGELAQIRTLLASISTDDTDANKRAVIQETAAIMGQAVESNAILLRHVWEGDKVDDVAESAIRSMEEDTIDVAQDEILDKIHEFNIPADKEGEIIRQLETAADKLHRVLLQVQRARATDRPFEHREEFNQRLLALHDRLTRMLKDVLNVLNKYCHEPNYTFDQREFARRILRDSDEVKALIKDIRKKFVGNGDGEVAENQVEAGNIPFVTATLDLYGRFRGNVLNVAQELAGQRGDREDEDDMDY